MPLEYEEESPEVAARRRGEDRRRELLALTAAFYHRVLRESPLAEGARAYLTSAASRPRCAERFQLGYSADEHARDRGSPQEASFADRELEETGITRRGRGGPVDRMTGRLIFTLFDTPRPPDRVRGQAPAARRVRREVRQLAGEPALAEGHDALRPAPRAHGDRARRGGNRRRGLHRRDRSRPGRLRERRRLDGHGADRAAAARAAQAGAQRRAAVRRRRRGQRGRAARSRAGERPRHLRVRVALPPRGSDPAEVAAAGREAVDRMLAGRAACSRSASRSCSTRPTSDSADGRDRGLRGAARDPPRRAGDARA